jgi:hypothetical protein
MMLATTFFTAEHDDHHLARITELMKLKNKSRPSIDSYA